MSAVIVVDTTATPPGASAPRASFGEITLSSSRGSVAFRRDTELMEGSVVAGPSQVNTISSRALGLDGTIRNRNRPRRREQRRLTFVVHVRGESAVARAELTRRLLGVILPYEGDEVILSAVDESGQPVTTSGDVEITDPEAFDPVAAWDRVSLVSFDLVCHDPNWYGAPRRNRQFTSAGVAFFPIFPMGLENSSGIGDEVALDIGGDWPTHATHTLTGPATGVWSAENGDGDRWEVDLTSVPLAGGETVTVRTDPRIVFQGTPRIEGPSGEDYAQYLTKRSLFALEPVDRITYEVAGKSTGTEVETSWRPALTGLL